MFNDQESLAILWRQQHIGVGRIDLLTGASVSGNPDLHLVFDWEWAEKEQKDICLLKVYSVSEQGETLKSQAYYVGFQAKPPHNPERYGSSTRPRYIDPNLDLSACSPEQAQAVIATPEALVQEIKDAVSGKFTDADVHFDNGKVVPGVNPAAYMRDEGWENKAVEHGQKVLNETVVPHRRSTGSRGWTPDEDGYLEPTNIISDKLNQDGETVPVREGKSGPRRDAPWWVLDAEVFDKFLEAHQKGPILINDSGSRLRDISEGLDTVILRNYYIRGDEDQEIFEDFKEQFPKEANRQRRTASVAALKKRRQRLVLDGNEMFGKVRNVIPISKPRFTSKKRLFIGVAGRG